MPVCITGMHRSGTSMVANLLHAAGLNLGPESNLLPATEENPAGYWEHRDFVVLNDDLLAAVGAGWDCPPPPSVDWSAPALAPLRSRAEALVASLADSSPWGWKDPRTCLTLPFWQSVMNPLKVVLVVRNPLAVASSLRERNGLSLALGLTLWRLSYERALAAVPATDRVLTHFDAYFNDPAAELQRVISGLGVDDTLDAGAATAISSDGTVIPRERFRHHQFTAQDLEQAGADGSVLELYAQLCQEAGWSEDASDTPALAPPLGTGLSLGSVETVSAGIGEADLATVEITSLRQVLDNLRLEHQEAIDELEREIAALRAEITIQRDRADEYLRQYADALASEDDLREELINAHQQLVYRDAEVMSTLGVALARYAPGAPAAIYYRQLLDRVRMSVLENLPPGAPVAVASMGDEAMLKLDGRQAWHFPTVESSLELTYSVWDTELLLDQLEDLRRQGAQYLLLPASSWSWSARYPRLNRWIETKYHSVIRDDGVAQIYDLRTQKPTAVGTV